MRSVFDISSDNWDDWLRQAVHVYNNTKHESTKLSPMDNKLQVCHKLAKENLIKSKERNKPLYDKTINPKNFKVGDQVMVKNEAKNGKLDVIWTG